MNRKLAVVVVGRNEGSRLGRCLDSVMRSDLPVVYVDSGSVDGSVELARRRGAVVVALSPSLPFTAGRARNEGLERALTLHPELDFVQFVDGDCEVVSGWLERGVRELEAQPQRAVVCGRVRERDRDRSIYHRLCDLEWGAPPPGETLYCGGNAMVRVRAYREAGGFRPNLIAGEEPELCVRLRRQGWKIFQVDGDMVLHDANMVHFTQWWRRSLRAGWAYAEGAALHGASRERHWVRQNCSIFFWGTCLPAVALLSAWPTHGLSLLLFGGYPALAMRVYSSAVRREVSPQDARLQALFTVFAKFPQAIGQAQFVVFRVFGKCRRVVDWRVAG